MQDVAPECLGLNDRTTGSEAKAMTIPDYQSLMLPVLLYAAQGEQRVPEVAERIADDLGLSGEEREEMLPSGRQRVLPNRIHWAKSHVYGPNT